MRIQLMGVLCALTLAAAPALTETNDPSAADRDWAAIQSLMTEHPDVDPGDSEAYVQWFQERTRRLRDLATLFYETHPDDPRRWDAVAMALTESINMPLEEDEEVMWAPRLQEMYSELMRAADAGLHAREQAAAYRIRRTLMALYGLQASIDAMARDFPDGELAGQLQETYLSWIEQHSPDKLERLLTALLESPNKSVRAAANGRLQLRQARTVPLELKFTALDGRKVDLAELRGKVVLLEFWATWCKPCVEEIPHLKKVYERYRDQGFEIIGIALDEEKDREKLLATVAAHGITWPQYFDGTGWNNPYRERFAINGIPATFLLDKDGKLAATQLHRDDLEAQVARLLGQANPS